MEIKNVIKTNQEHNTSGPWLWYIFRGYTAPALANILKIGNQGDGNFGLVLNNVP